MFKTGHDPARDKASEAKKAKMEKRKQDFLNLFEQKANNIMLTCKAIGIERATYYQWYKEDDEFKEKVEHLNEGQIDFAETALKKQIQDGNITAIIFFLKTKGRSRGYVERTELVGTGIDNRIQIEIVDANPTN